MNIDGVNTLACLCRIDRNESKDTKIYPLPHSQSPVTWLALWSNSAHVNSPGCSVHSEGPRPRSYALLQAVQVNRAVLEER